MTKFMTKNLSQAIFTLKSSFVLWKQKRAETLDFTVLSTLFICVLKTIFFIGVTGFEPCGKTLITPVFTAFF